MKVRRTMRFYQPFGITNAKPHMLMGVRETDIRDSYVASPIAATSIRRSLLRRRPVPLSTRRLTRRGRD
jgi:hypothetical protein